MSRTMKGKLLKAGCRLALFGLMGLAADGGTVGDAHVVLKAAEFGAFAEAHPDFAKAMAFLARTDLDTVKPGRYGIDGDRCWANVMETDLKPFGDDNQYEAHDAFIDIQMPVRGRETIGLLETPDDELAKGGWKDDAILFRAKGRPVTLNPGEAVVLFPRKGAHAPCLSSDGTRKVRKVVVKLRASKPMAIISADTQDSRAVECDVCVPNRIEFVRFDATNAPAVSTWGAYAAVYLGQKLPGGDLYAKSRGEIEAWVRAGGTLVLAGEATLAAIPEFDPGEGRVVRFRKALGQLRYEFARDRRSLGEADGAGVFVLTEEGKEVDRLKRAHFNAVRNAKGLSFNAAPNEWEPKPLGTPGTLKPQYGFARKPVFRKPPKRADGIDFTRGGKPGVIVLDDRKATALAFELQYHLETMLGAEVAIVGKVPKDRPSIYVRLTEEGARGRSVIRRDGESLILEGRGFGLSHAVTYLLEALGCRYLWPGPTGKIIPRRASLVIPEITLDYTPEFLKRELRRTYHFRPGTPATPVQARLKIDHERQSRQFLEERADHEGNRDFWGWHGIAKESDFDGDYSWGHFFGDYWDRFGKTHPEYFALQPNGTRHLEMYNRRNRPTLCLSNEGLVEQTANDLKEVFRRSPNAKVLSVCLPDGGYPSPCMCRKCRELDPVNAAPAKFRVTEPWHCTFDYVAFSDRVIDFANRVQAKVREEFPGRGVSTYIYSNYEAYPAKVTPDPDLLLLSCAGWYTTKKGRDDIIGNLSAWARFGNRILWRPNVLSGYDGGLPQNYARHIFEDVEAMKANGVIGTDFDCMNDFWLTRGLVYYMVAKAHLNPDRLGYDDLLDDYCAAGYGPAAVGMRAYYDELERACDAAFALAGDSQKKPGCPDEMLRLSKTLDFAKLEALLVRAEKAAAGDRAVLERISFQRAGIAYGRHEAAVSLAEDAGAANVQALRDAYMQYVHDHAFDHPGLMAPYSFLEIPSIVRANLPK